MEMLAAIIVYSSSVLPAAWASWVLGAHSSGMEMYT